MDEKTQKVSSMLDESARLQKGEWTQDGRKLLKFRITEIEVHSSCSFDDETNKFVSGLYYILSGIGFPNAIINVHRIEPVIENAIGTLDFYLSEEGGEEYAFIKIFLSSEDFEDFTHTVSALSFKGEFELQVIVQEREESKISDTYLVESYAFQNILKLTSGDSIEDE